MEGPFGRFTQEVGVIEAQFPFERFEDALAHDILAFGFGFTDDDGQRIGRVWQLRYRQAFPTLAEVELMIADASAEVNAPTVSVDTYARSKFLSDLKVERTVDTIHIPIAEAVFRDWQSMAQFAVDLHQNRAGLEFRISLIAEDGNARLASWKLGENTHLIRLRAVSDLIDNARLELGCRPAVIQSEITWNGVRKVFVEEPGPPDHELIKTIYQHWYRFREFWKYKPPNY